MRDAMANADVGDDVYGEDPTVNALEALAAQRIGFAASLFVPSGTMSNLLALLTHCGRGDEYIAGQQAHTYKYEGGGGAVFGGIQPQPLPFQIDGTLDLDAVEAAIKPDDFHFAKTRLLCLENTLAGMPLPLDYVAARSRAVRSAQARDAPRRRAHLQCGVSQRVPVTDADGRIRQRIGVFVEGARRAGRFGAVRYRSSSSGDARRWRKMLGGGMRQSGILAAAGIHALNHHVERLEQTTRRARLTWPTRSAIFAVFAGKVRCATNMVFVELAPRELAALTKHFEKRQIRVRGPRWVMHLDVDDDGRSAHHRCRARVSTRWG